MQDLVAIAKIAKPHGLKGETVADILTDFPERFNETGSVIAILPTGERRNLEIKAFRFQKNRILLSFFDINSIEEAEFLRNAEICIPESETVQLVEGEFFDWELNKCFVETVEGEKIGRVIEVLRTGGTEVLIVQGAVKEYLIPFAESICISVDLENCLIKIDPPEGLLDF